MVVPELAQPLRRKRGGSPRGNSRRARLATRLEEEGRGGVPRPMGSGLGKHKDESHMSIVYYIVKTKIHSTCEIEDFVQTHICKLCVILRSRVLLSVFPS